MPRTDLQGSCGICGQMHMLPRTGQQSFLSDRWQKSAGRPMKQIRRRHLFWQIQFNWNRMTLIRPNAGSVCCQTEPLLIIRLHDAANHLVRKDNVLFRRVRN